ARRVHGGRAKIRANVPPDDRAHGIPDTITFNRPDLWPPLKAFSRRSCKSARSCTNCCASWLSCCSSSGRFCLSNTGSDLVGKLQLVGCYMTRDILASIETQRCSATDKQIEFFA